MAPIFEILISKKSLSDDLCKEHLISKSATSKQLVIIMNPTIYTIHDDEETDEEN